MKKTAKETMTGVFIAALVYISFTIGQVTGARDVRERTKVVFGAPYYSGVYFGSCQTEVWFAGQRGMACATDVDP